MWDPDLGGDMGPTFRIPILELMPNVISKIKPFGTLIWGVIYGTSILDPDLGG
jgi:hypothetical protein